MNKSVAQSYHPLPEILDDTAKRLASLGLIPIALFLLEAHRPISNVLYNLTLFAQPFLSPIFGSHRIHILKLILEDPALLDQFIVKLESLDATNAPRKQISNESV